MQNIFTSDKYHIQTNNDADTPLGKWTVINQKVLKEPMALERPDRTRVQVGS